MKIKNNVKKKEQIRVSFVFICQFLVVCTTRYLLQDILTTDEFGWHARIYYSLFILLYFPSFLAMVTFGISKSISHQFLNKKTEQVFVEEGTQIVQLGDYKVIIKSPKTIRIQDKLTGNYSPISIIEK